MSDLNLSAKSYLDFAGLGELRSRAKTNDQSAAQEVGRQFEAMFVQMVFKSMREANAPLKKNLPSVTVTKIVTSATGIVTVLTVETGRPMASWASLTSSF